MQIAYTMAPGQGDTDSLLLEVAHRMMAEGLRIVGTVQVNQTRAHDQPCDMDVQVLPDGPMIRISQSLGAFAKGCRLDPEALETAVFEVEERLLAGADLLIINKFGKHEASGHGFRSTVVKAMSQDIPVLAGTNSLNIQAFQEFTAGHARRLAPNVQTLMTWCKNAARQARAVERTG